MKAAVIYENSSPDVLRYEDVADPECRDGRVLIDVEAISSEGGDLLARAGSPPRSVPHIVGYLAVGTVVAVGAGVEDRAVGDRIVTLNPAGPRVVVGDLPGSLTSPRGASVVAARPSRAGRRLSRPYSEREPGSQHGDPAVQRRLCITLRG
jgi:NADPH:quinone reductase-like Zn-dependent oxidoreductase